MQAASDRVMKERLAFDTKLETLLDRCKSGHQSEITLKEMKLGRVLGEGNFGKVLVAEPKHKGSGMPNYMALKIQAKREMAKDKKELQHVRDEKNLMFAMDSPFLVGCVDYFSDRKTIYFALELCNAGEMWSIIQQQKKKRIPKKMCQFWLAQVLLAFEYMHNLDICYRDLKPENLLVDFKGNARLTDFGFAKRVTEITWSMCGTPDYMVRADSIALQFLPPPPVLSCEYKINTTARRFVPSPFLMHFIGTRDYQAARSQSRCRLVGVWRAVLRIGSRHPTV